MLFGCEHWRNFTGIVRFRQTAIVVYKQCRDGGYGCEAYLLNFLSESIRTQCLRKMALMAQAKSSWWWSGVVVSELAINEVNLRRARLVLRWATMSWFNSRCRTLIICPIAIAYSMGQIIKSVCVCVSVCLSVCLSVCGHSRSHFLINFHQNWHRSKNPEK